MKLKTCCDASDAAKPVDKLVFDRCGKSVIGEAVAFALGGSKKMLRVRQLGSLINTGLLRQPNPKAQVEPRTSTLSYVSAYIGRVLSAT